VTLFVGDDWAEDHHDVEILDEAGTRLGRARLPEGMSGMTRLHEMIAEHLDEDAVDTATGMLCVGVVVVGIETDRGPWVAALVAAGYQVFAINPMSVARYRERHATSGAKSDPGDAHVLGEIVRLDRAHHRPVAGDTAQVEGLKMVARMHQTLVWDRTRHVQRLRSALREYFPAALEALVAAKLDLADLDALELLERAPDPDRAARLSRSKIAGILRRARRRDVEDRAERLQTVLRAPALRQPAALQAAYATVAGTQIRLLIGILAQLPQAPGCSPSSETTPTATATRRPARTTPAPHRSPAPPAAGAWYWPATPATGASATRSISGRSARSPPHPAPGPTTTRCEPAGPATTPPYANSATDSSESCTAASKPEPTTTKPPPGPTTPPPPLDTATPWDV